MDKKLFPDVFRPNYIFFLEDYKKEEQNLSNNNLMFIILLTVIIFYYGYDYFTKRKYTNIKVNQPRTPKIARKNNREIDSLEDEIEYFFYKRNKITKTIVILGDNNKKDNISKKFYDKIFLMNSIDRILSFLSRNKGTDLDIILHCEGANVSDCDLICSYLFRFSKDSHTNIYIPYYAFSSGTCIALCCDKIYLGPYAVLGPTDPQVDFSYGEESNETFSIGTYQKFLKGCMSKNKKYDVELEAINILMGLDADVMMDDNDQLMKNLLEKHIDNSLDVQIALMYLNKGNIPHHKPLTQDILNELKIKYEIFEDNDIFEIINKIVLLEGRLPRI